MTNSPATSVHTIANDLLEPTVDYQAPSDEAFTEQDRELQRLLTLGTVVEEAMNPSTAFTKIGAGACGAIFARVGSSVLKLAKPSPFSLSNDYQKHKLIRSHMLANGVHINIPECHWFMDAHHAGSFFNANPQLAEVAGQVCNLPTSVLATQRIPPLPATTRAHLIRKFCAPHIRAEALQARANRDCLVRIYLGSMDGRSNRRVFSLRNLPLHLNQIVDLRLEVRAVCREMARALAVMHWAAQTDARDVEFVLGGSSSSSSAGGAQATTSAPGASGTCSDLETQTVELWLLDFNLVRDVDLENEEDHDAVLAKLVSAHDANDRYYPRPCQAHPLAKTLWNVFVTAYLETASLVLSNRRAEVQMLPGRFLQALVALERARKEVGSE
ncbi:DUF3669 domain-containing protein [Microdochium nivale]|nr:DUF3669 domain-containing protein [Microdochium nivale]